MKPREHPGRVAVRCCLVRVLTVVLLLVLSFCFQLQLCISNSSWSDAFSLDTVGSYGCVRCPANSMDYLVTAQRFQMQRKMSLAYTSS